VKGLTSSGHASAKVTRHAEVDLVTHRARLVYTVEPGPFATFGAVKFEGLGTLPEDTVRDIFGVREDQRYNSEELDEGKQALLDLGVFGSVDVVTDLSNMGTTHVVPVTVKTQPSKIRAFLVGMGVELDQLKTDVHVQVGWQNANFLGGLRKLDIRYKPGIVLYPTRIDNVVSPDKPLYEHRLSATLRQPNFIEKRTTGFAKAEYNLYPVLLPKKGPKLEDTVLGYHEPRGSIGVERKFLDRVLVTPEYDIQGNFPLDYLGHTEAAPLVISYVQLAANLDLRDDPNKPHKGLWVGNTLQFAGGPVLRGDAVDLRVQPDVRGYIPMPKKIGGVGLPTMTLAVRGSVGFLFPFNYSTFSQANFSTESDARAEGSDRDYQVLFFRGFFSGGPSTNRGYPLRGVGPHDAIPYLSPAGQSASAGGCDPRLPACQLPTGGLTLWETNVELRINVSGPFSTAVFCDAGDVSPFQTDIRPTHPHLSCGGGARYDTPVGPLRLDIGYRIPGAQFPDGDRYELEPTPLFGVAPIAVAFGIGETF
jgi:outer membrane protein insertion porin family/translocation and assembly module TamA